jgi:hypothetical protein
MSVDVTQVEALVANDGYPVMFQSYDAIEQVAPRICEVVPTDGSDYGHKGSVIVGLGRPKVTRDGQEIEADTFKTAFTWYGRIDRLTRRLDIPKRLLDAVDARAKIGGMVAQAAKAWGTSFAQEKEQRAADFFQKGTLSAGDVTVFDGSFPGEADPNPKYIYDGKPLFAATGNGHVLAANTATPFNLTVSLALSSTNLQTVLTTMRDTNAVDDRGQKVMIRPRDLIVPPGLEFTAKNILNSALVPGSGNNDINVVQGMLNPVVWRFLTDDTDAWYVGTGEGIRIYDSGEPQIEVQYDAKTQTMYVIAYSYHGIVCTDWRGYYAANKATS